MAQLLVTVISTYWFVAPVAAKQASSITCNATPVTIDQSTKISVTLTDAATGEGIDSKFYLYYSIDGGVSWRELGMGIMGMGSLSTDAEGKFSSNWNPRGHLPHDYLLKARWDGNDIYDECMVIAPLTVSLPSEVPLVLNNVYDFVSDGTHYVVGEIKNIGSENLEYVKVAVGYYDSAGNVIDAEISYIPADILTPNQVSPFIFQRSGAAEVARYEVVVSDFSATAEEPYLDFECSNHRWVDPKVVGFVENTGSMNAISIKVTAVFYDASDKVLGYDTGYAFRSILKPGEKSPFSVICYDLFGEPHHYTLFVESDTTTEQPCTSVQAVSHIGQKSDGSYIVSGEIENAGTSCVEAVEVISAFYDVDGNIIDCNFGDVPAYSLIPEQTSEFSVTTYSNTNEINHYELWTQCMEISYWCDVEATWKIFVTSNSSSVMDISFDRSVKTIRFTVDGDEGIGWCRVVAPKQMLGGPFTVLVDGATVTHTQTDNATHNVFTFTYQHSEHTVEIIGTTVAKETSMIFCSVDPTSASYDDLTVEISGYITPLVDETKSVPVTLQYSQDSMVWADIATVTSSSEARYQYVWSPALDVGTYYVRARWGGSSTYLNATSEAALFTVTTVTMTTSLSLSKTSITEGNEIIVSGAIEPSEQVLITLTYTMPDGSTLARTMTSSSDGQFSDSFTPTIIGSWSVKASWTSSETQEVATSSTKSFTVVAAESGSEPENGDETESRDALEMLLPFWIVIVAVAVIAAIAVAVIAVIVTRRKK